MAIVISGVNNNDKITATDGLIDVLSGVSFNSEVTVPSFKVGSNIQLGNAGIATATTFVGNLTGNVTGNVTGNINATSNLLLQIGGSEKFRVGSSGQLGIGGANYGTSGQVLTSGGSGSAATWSSIPAQVVSAFASGANNRIITATSASAITGEANLTFDGSTLAINSTTGLGLPMGTSANEPSAGSYKGHIRYNNDDDEIYFSNGTVWKKINSTTVVLSSVSGTIYAGSGTNLTLAGQGFLSSGLVVNFVQSSDSINVNVTVTPTSDTAATVAVPAAVYNNVTAGNVVTIKVTNSDSNTSGTKTLTASSLPTGGNITTYSSGGTNYRVHSFTSSGTFTNTIANLSVTYLIVAGGGGGGSNGDVGGGGGAGGLLQGTTTASVQGYSIVVGAGGVGGCGGQGGGGGCNGSQGGTSSAFGQSAVGGGGGGTRNNNGRNGGSGGGGGDAYTGRPGGSGTSGQGHNGGHSPNMDSNNGNDQGGGGGAGGAGNSYNPGPGLSISITGTAVEYARGGTGSNHPQARQAPANSGDGGRGNYHQSNSLGGSGIVIIRYEI